MTFFICLNLSTDSCKVQNILVTSPIPDSNAREVVYLNHNHNSEATQAEVKTAPDRDSLTCVLIVQAFPVVTFHSWLLEVP